MKFEETLKLVRDKENLSYRSSTVILIYNLVSCYIAGITRKEAAETKHN